MKKVAFGSVLVMLSVLAVACRAASVTPNESYVDERPGTGSFPLVADGDVATLVVEAQNWPGVARAVRSFQKDLADVTGGDAQIRNTLSESKGNVVIIGTLGKSPAVDNLVKAGKVNVTGIQGKWESFIIQVVDDPAPGISKALVIAGSDKRGTIYGVYDVSEKIGVSPWHFWADAKPAKKSALYVKNGVYQQGEPSVKYRGIFINDEAPDLSGWVAEKYGNVAGMRGVANYNSEMYEHVFDLLLRLKANYLWPAMWNNAFNEDDPKNAALADEMGIVMGTSHQEPMLRAQKEWDRRHRQSWNYYRDAKSLQEFWREGLERNKRFESIITMGLRGANDTEMIPNGTVQQSMDLLKEIVAEQRKIISETINPDPTKVPQLWCPYKEVLEYYNEGFRVPEDVTLLWTDDNWGNIRRVPTAEERGRAGGAGVYYHMDYVGAIRNYKWVNTNSIPKIWEQMTWAKEHGSDRVWIVNVGHLRGLELPLEYFMHLGWDTKRWSNDTTREYTEWWAEREFGKEHAKEIAEILVTYTRNNSRRKPELLDPGTYSLVHYQEAERVVAGFNDAAARAQALYEQMPAEKKDAFYQMVLFPTKACAQVTDLYVSAGKNALYAKQGRASANDWAQRVTELFNADAALMKEYNTRNNGRWNHFMDQTHIGYTSWQDPRTNIKPATREVALSEAPGLGVAIEGSEKAWPASEECKLPAMDVFNKQQRYVDLFNRGKGAVEFQATTSAPWILVSKAAGKVEKEERLLVNVDWSKAPTGKATGHVTLRAGDATVNVALESFKPTDLTPETAKGFVEGDGVVSMEAGHFARAVAGTGAAWKEIEDYGRTQSGMTPLPMTAPSVIDTRKGACLEYGMYIFNAPSDKQVTLTTTVGPSLNTNPERGLRVAVSMDDEEPQILTIVPKGYDAQKARDWGNAVKESCRRVVSKHTIGQPGYHTVKVWMVDPGVVVEKLVVDLGGLKESSLGPPESFRGQ